MYGLVSSAHRQAATTRVSKTRVQASRTASPQRNQRRPFFKISRCTGNRNAGCSCSDCSSCFQPPSSFRSSSSSQLLAANPARPTVSTFAGTGETAADSRASTRRNFRSGKILQ